MERDIRISTVTINRRLLAYVLDWAIGGVVTGFPAVLIYGIVTKRNDIFSNLYVFEALGYSRLYGYLAGILCLISAFIYYVFIPLKILPGQTLGKKIEKIQIKTWNNDIPNLRCLLLRYGTIFIFETPLFIISSYFMQILTLVIRFYIESIWSYVGLVFTLISIIMVIYTKRHNAIHDLIAKTKVVDISE